MAETNETFTIYLTLTAQEGSPRVPLKVPKSITTSDLLSNIATETKIPTPKVIFRGRLVKAGTTDAVVEFKLEEGSVLHCMGKPVSAEESTETTPAAASLPQVTVAGGSAPAAAASLPAAAPLPAALAQLKAQNPPATYKTAITTLQKLLTNITDHPMEDKYRRIKKGNAAFNKRLGHLPGARGVILACGFTETDELYEMQATAEAWPALVEAVNVVQAAATAAAAAPMPPAMMPGFPAMPGGFPGMPPGQQPPGFGNMPPHMQEAMRSMLSDPAQVQRMLQDPMVQSMLQSHPEAQQALQQMQNMPPEQLAMFSQMLSAQAASGNMFSGAAGGAPVPAAAAANNNDPSQTEEDMIAEAIRRSLDDQNNNNNNNNGSSS